MNSPKFNWKIIPAGLLIIALLAVIAYVAFVFLTYSRIEDNVELEVQGKAEEAARTGREYTAVTYNIGFGAYTADFTFFMDGGKESGMWTSRRLSPVCLTKPASGTVFSRRITILPT